MEENVKSDGLLRCDLYTLDDLKTIFYRKEAQRREEFFVFLLHCLAPPR